LNYYKEKNRINQVNFKIHDGVIEPKKLGATNEVEDIGKVLLSASYDNIAVLLSVSARF